MLFPTVDFAIFFIVVFVGHWLLNHLSGPWKWFMIVASYVFYSWWDWRFIFLLLGVSVLAQLGAIAVSRTRPPRMRLAVNCVAVALLLLPLAFFKYYGFFAVNATNLLSELGAGPSRRLLGRVGGQLRGAFRRRFPRLLGHGLGRPGAIVAQSGRAADRGPSPDGRWPRGRQPESPSDRILEAHGRPDVRFGTDR